MTAWFLVALTILVVLLLIVRRTGWNGPVMFWQGRYASDVTLRTRMTEDAMRDAIDKRDETDLAP